MAKLQKDLSRDLSDLKEKSIIIQDVIPEIEPGLREWRQYTSQPKPIPDSVAIANYSGVLTCYEMLFNNSCVIDAGMKKVLIVQPFWLDSVHESRLDSEWGQFVREFPPNIGKLFIQLFPELGKKPLPIQGEKENLVMDDLKLSQDEKRVTFRQVKAVREECLRLLAASGKYEILRGECRGMELKEETVTKLPTEFQQLEGDLELEMVIDTFLTTTRSISQLGQKKSPQQLEYIEIVMENNEVHRYEIDETVKVFNFSQKAMADQGQPHLPSQTEVYRCPRGQEPSNIICLGSGLSAVWLKEQVGESSKVEICVRNAASRLPPALKRNDGRTLTLEECVRMDLHRMMNVQAIMQDVGSIIYSELQEQIREFAKLNDINLDTVTPNTSILLNKETKEIVSMGEAVVAYGYQTNNDLTSKLPQEMLVLPDPLQRNKEKDFIAPKNIPGDAGFARFYYHKTQILAEKFKVEDIDIAALVFTQKDKMLLSHDWKVDMEFMDHLAVKIKELEDTPEDSAQFIKDIYKTWSEENNKIFDEGFDDRVDDLFERCALRSENKL